MEWDGSQLTRKAARKMEKNDVSCVGWGGFVGWVFKKPSVGYVCGMASWDGFPRFRKNFGMAFCNPTPAQCWLFTSETSCRSNEVKDNRRVFYFDALVVPPTLLSAELVSFSFLELPKSL